MMKTIRLGGWISATTVVACTSFGCSSSDDPGGPGKPPEPIVNLVTDANRDGTLETDAKDETGEETWSKQAGAVFLVNVDDDDGDGVADNEDEVVNGPADGEDLATFAVQGWDRAPKTASGTLAFDDVSRPFVRVFRAGANGLTVVDTSTPIALGASELQQNQIFAIEGKDFVRTRQQAWQGLVTITLTVMDGEEQVGTDVAQMRAAPWLMNHNLRKFDRVYSSDAFPLLTGTFPEPLDEAGVAYETYSDNEWGDIWAEDLMQTGWTGMPTADGVHGMVIFNPRPWGRQAGDKNLPVTFLREHMLGPDRGVAIFYDEQTETDTGTSGDSHGNHDALPPYPAAPDGRIVYGSGLRPGTKEFYAAQELQPPIEVDSSWLLVGHVDEVWSYVKASTPTGFKVLENTPSLCQKMFKDWEAQGNGDAPLFSSRSGWDAQNKWVSWDTTLAKANARTDLQQWNQAAQVRVDQMHDDLIQQSGLTEDDFIPIPVLYEEIDKGKIAWLPDSANIRVVDSGEMAIFAQTVGPYISGEDAMQKYFEDTLGKPGLDLGADGQGLKVRFADSWDYHVLEGDIHCASNWTALPQKDEMAWWEALP
jgi:protein-arginine deiminase